MALTKVSPEILDLNNTAGTSNLRLGVNAGNSIVSGGNYNVVIGDEAGTALTTGDGNVAVGFEALTTEDANGNNVAVGYRALKVQNAGAEAYNVAVGVDAGLGLTTATSSTLIGAFAGGGGTLSGANNTAIGRNAGYTLTSGTQNVLIGGLAGDGLTTGSNNVIVGYDSDIDNSGRVGAVALGSELATHAANNSFRVKGDGGVFNTGNTSAWNTTSDRRIKKNITDSTVGLAEINKIQVRNFEYRTAKEITDSELQSYDLEDLAINKTGEQVGCIAQELAEIIPSAVVLDDRGVNNVQGDELIWHVIKAIQEQTALITSLTDRIVALEA